MKINFICGLAALSLLCVSINPLAAQSFAAEADISTQLFTSATSEQNVSSNAVKYTSIDLSDPAVYAGEQFRIFVGLENTGKQAESHTVAIYRMDASEGKVLMSSKELSLAAGQNTELTFTLAPENLLVKGKPAPESFIFIIGGQEIVVKYVK